MSGTIVVMNEATGKRRGFEEGLTLNSNERHYIGDQGIHCGDVLELRGQANGWTPVRYEVRHVERYDGRTVRVGYLIKDVLGHSFTADVDGNMVLRFARST